MNKITTLVGSTRFAREYKIIYEALSLRGFPVFTIGCLEKCQGHSEIDKARLDALHMYKISISDTIWVIDTSGESSSYIGESTRTEINFAGLLDKDIHYLSDNLGMFDLRHAQTRSST